MYLCDSEDLVLIYQHTVITETACQTARHPVRARARALRCYTERNAVN